MPLRLQDGGESGAAAGHGVAQAAPAVAEQRWTPGGMARQAVQSRVTREDTRGRLQQGVSSSAGLLPGFGGDARVQDREAEVRKVLADKQVCDEDAPSKDWSAPESSEDDDGLDVGSTSGGRSNVSIEDSSASVDTSSVPGHILLEKEMCKQQPGEEERARRKTKASGGRVPAPPAPPEETRAQQPITRVPTKPGARTTRAGPSTF